MVPYLQMAGDRTRLVAAVLVMTILDVGLDIFNVLIVHGGIFGMGIASSLSYYAAVIVGLGCFIKKDCLFKLRLKGLRLSLLREILSEGVPTVINQLSLVLLILLFYVLNHIYYQLKIL